MGSSARQARRPYEVIFTPLARAELELAWAWYDERSERAAARFLDLMDHLVEQVGEAPRQFPVVRGDIRRALAVRTSDRAGRLAAAAVASTGQPGSCQRRRRGL